MSKPKTLSLQGFKIGGELVDESKWVSAEDYAALQAEKEAETKATFDAIRLITQLRDENERLRKAGDAVVAAYCAGDANVEKWKEYPVVREWLAAKGVQS